MSDAMVACCSVVF